MRFITSFVTLLLLSVSAFALTIEIDVEVKVDGVSVSNSTETKVTPYVKPAPSAKVCDPNAAGPDLGDRQYAALASFTKIYGEEQNVTEAFNRWIPGQYIQHNPFSQQGRAFAIQFLSTSFATTHTINSNFTIWAGQGFGGMHYKMSTPNITWAVLDMFRFQGTCIVEHWDVLQQITGQEVNPIAFF